MIDQSNYIDLISNKIFALKSIKVNTERLIFIDSDMILLNKIEYLPDGYDLLAVNSFKSHINNWNEILKHFDIEYDYFQFKTIIDQVKVPPYFNSGFLSILNSKKDELCDEWLRYYLYLRSNPNILKSQNHFADQVSLTIALLKNKISHYNLDINFNYPVKYLPLEHHKPIYFVHYHNPKILFARAELKELVYKYFEEYDIHYLLKNNHLWNFYINKSPMKYWYLLKYYLSNV